MHIAGTRFTTTCCLVAIIFVLAECQVARAGWTGLINGVGNGWASVNVRSSTSHTNQVTTRPNTASPSAAMAPTTGYKTNGPLPVGAATATYSRIKGLPGGIWQAAAHSSNGDGTDNPELQSQATVTPADCASITFTSQINQTQQEFNANGNSGTITVDATATGGTALWLRGYEYDGDMTNIPPDDPTTVQNESVVFLQQNGTLRFNALLIGPFDYGDASNGCPLIIPFTLTSSNLENLIFVSDSVTLSLPMAIQCPPDVTVKCSDPITYPTVSFAGCGIVNIAFNPPLPAAGFFSPGSFPIGTTPVTVTATDSDGNTTNCTFNVTVVGTPPIPPPLPTLTGETSVQVPTPTGMEVCGGTTNPITGTTTNATSYNTQGTFTVNWTFDDGHGDVLTTNQTVIVHDDIPPVPPTIPDAIGECSVTVTTVPVAVDNVAGNVNGTTTNPLTYTTQGTNFITWTFTDENGNQSTAVQRVIVHDDIPPMKPTLPDLNFNTCSGGSVTPPAPTTTDNCAGVVTGTTTTPFPITTLGTNVVTWTFSDGNGNTTTANQNIIITGLTFSGFFSPIAGTGGTCSSPLRTINEGSIIPIKFDMSCGSTLITGGTPPIVQVQAYAKNCTPGGDLITQPAQFQNDWHYNWDTSGFAKGVYKVIVVLPDGSSQYAFVSLK